MAIMLATVIVCLFNRSLMTSLLYLETLIILVIVALLMSTSWSSGLIIYLALTIPSAIGCIFADNLYFNPFAVYCGSILILLIGYTIGKKINFKAVKKRKIKNIKARTTTIISFIYFLSFCVGLYYLFKNRALLFGVNINDGRVEAQSGNGLLLYFTQLQIMLVPLIYIMHKQGKVSRAKFIIVACLTSIELIMIGFRTPLFTMIVTLVLLKIKLNELKLNQTIAILIFLSFVLLLWGVFRENSSLLLSGIANTLEVRLKVPSDNLNRVFSYFPRVKPFQHGYAQAIDLLMLLPGPQEDFTLWLKNILNMNFSGGGVSIPMQGSFYIDFGYSGMFIGMFAIGIIKGIIDDRIDRKSTVNFWSGYLPIGLTFSTSVVTQEIIVPTIFLIVYEAIKVTTGEDICINKQELIKKHEST